MSSHTYGCCWQSLAVFKILQAHHAATPFAIRLVLQHTSISNMITPRMVGRFRGKENSTQRGFAEDSKISHRGLAEVSKGTHSGLTERFTRNSQRTHRAEDSQSTHRVPQDSRGTQVLWLEQSQASHCCHCCMQGKQSHWNARQCQAHRVQFLHDDQDAIRKQD